MTLRTTLATVVEMVREEASISTNSSRGTDHLAHIQRLVKSHYTALSEEYDWEFLALKRNDSAARKVLSAGSRVYSFPASVNPLRIKKAWVKWSGVWSPLSYGIDFDSYSAYDPSDDQRVDPVMKWDFQDDDEFEVWPIPATNGTTDGDNEVAFEGQKAIEALTATSSRLDMDDLLVSLMAAAEVLAENGQQTRSQIKAGRAQKRLEALMRNTGSKKRVAMGLGVIEAGGYNQRWPRHPMFIR